MSFDPNTEENRLRKQNDELKKIREEVFFTSSNVNEANEPSAFGTKAGYGGLNVGAMGEQIIETVSEWGEAVVGGAIEIGSALVKIGRDVVNDATGEALVSLFKGSDVEGHVFYMKPNANETVRICGTDPNTSPSTDGNVLTDDDIIITDRQIAKFRYQKDVTFTDGGGGWILESKSDATGGGTGSGSSITAWKQPARINGTGTLDLTPQPEGNYINSLAVIWGIGSDLVEGDRVLLTGMSVANLNGIWELTGTTNTFPPIAGTFYLVKRPVDFDTSADVISESFCAIEEGTHADTLWHLTTDNPITLDDTGAGTAQVWEEFGAVGSGSLPVGTDNQHLEWRIESGTWEARTNLEFGASGPWADAGFLRFPVDGLISWRDTGDQGNVELKVTTDNWIDWTMSDEGQPTKWRLRANSNPTDVSFSIQQNPDDGTDTFGTFMTFPEGRFHLFRGGTEIMAWNENGDVDHKHNNAFDLKNLIFQQFTGAGGQGKAIARFGTLDGNTPDFEGNVGGLHIDIEEAGDVVSFRFGELGNNFETMAVGDSYVDFAKPIVFDDINEPASVPPVDPFPDQRYRIFRGTDGLVFQNGNNDGFMGAMEFRDLNADIRVDFDFTGKFVGLNHTSGGLHVRTNLSDDDSVVIHPSGGDLQAVTPWVTNTDAMIYYSASGTSNDGLTFTGGFGVNQVMRLNENLVNIWEDVDFSKRATIPSNPSVAGSDLLNTGNIETFAHDTYDIGRDTVRYNDGFFSNRVRTPFVGEGSNIVFTDNLIGNVIQGQGSWVTTLNGTQIHSSNWTKTTFRHSLEINTTNNSFGDGAGSKDRNYLQIWQVDDPDNINAGSNSGKLFSNEVVINSDDDTEVHPFWIGENMPNAVDLLAGTIGDTGAGNQRKVRVWSDAGWTPSTGVLNPLDGVDLQIGDRILLTGTVDPADNGIYQVTSFTFGTLVANIQRSADFDEAVDGEMVGGTEVYVEEGDLGEHSIWFLVTELPFFVGIDDIFFKPRHRKGYVVHPSTTNLDAYPHLGLGDGWDEFAPNRATPPLSEFQSSVDWWNLSNILFTPSDKYCLGWRMQVFPADHRQQNISIDFHSGPSIFPDFSYTVTQQDIDEFMEHQPEGFETENITYRIIWAGDVTGSGGNDLRMLLLHNGRPWAWLTDFTDSQNVLWASGNNCHFGHFESGNHSSDSVVAGGESNIPPLKAGDTIELRFWHVNSLEVSGAKIQDIAFFLVPQQTLATANISTPNQGKQMNTQFPPPIGGTGWWHDGIEDTNWNNFWAMQYRMGNNEGIQWEPRFFNVAEINKGDILHVGDEVTGLWSRSTASAMWPAEENINAIGLYRVGY